LIANFHNCFIDEPETCRIIASALIFFCCDVGRSINLGFTEARSRTPDLLLILFSCRLKENFQRKCSINRLGSSGIRYFLITCRNGSMKSLQVPLLIMEKNQVNGKICLI